jgi:CRISPR-associated endonuclease/helicase Cas3
MNEDQFRAVFSALMGNEKGHFPWQWALYQRFESGDFPPACNLPTGLGKTSVIALWLIALAHAPDKVPRRLVYVVNRRTVVDQSTREAEKLRGNLGAAGLTELLARLSAVPADPPLAISTLRGQFADNREWSRDPARPAVIVGTVDMIGSRLLFSGYGAGFKSRPLFAGFLGQDVLLVHDEAHLEPAFQQLIEAIRDEQERCGEFRQLHIMPLTATPRAGADAFELTPEESSLQEVIPDTAPESLRTVWGRLKAKKHLALTPVTDDKQVVPMIIELALRHKESGKAILVFVRTVEAVMEVERGLTSRGKVSADNIRVLTGTIRGLERDRLTRDKTVFARFLPGGATAEKTVYLVCTAAGEVGVDMSAGHLVCDLTPFDSMAQRFGRVNRYGTGDARIDVVHEAAPSAKRKDDPFDQRRWQALELLRDLNGDASPAAITRLDPDRRQAAFTPSPAILPTSDILFDAWALTTVRVPLPGRPPVADWLHGVAEWEPPETYVAWREEVGLLRAGRFTPKLLEDLLDDYPLKPHELLRDRTDRVFKHLDQLAGEYAKEPVWVIAADDSVQVTTLGDLVERGVDELEGDTVLLPPAVGGLTRAGMLGPADTGAALDVADEWRDENGARRRERVWDDEEPEDRMMRLVRTIDITPEGDDGTPEDEGGPSRRIWRWYVRPRLADDDGSKSAHDSVPLGDHLLDTERAAKALAGRLLPEPLASAVILAARFHDLGKDRDVWQRSIGNVPTRENPNPVPLAKSAGSMRPTELSNYRHEFGSLLEVLDERKAIRLTLDQQPDDLWELTLHLIAAHHGRGRPHFPAEEAFDPEKYSEADAEQLAREVPRRFARLQRRYGRWGLAYLESLVRAADHLASGGYP